MLVAAVFELDAALGMFAAGILANAVLKEVKAEYAAEVMDKVEIVGFSFLISVFSVTSGVNFNLAPLRTLRPAAARGILSEVTASVRGTGALTVLIFPAAAKRLGR
ncbi:hypothetical protein [Glutamicibacter sp. AOP3-A1-12]|uniref:hypothetical protein n=1 Tax=Glutamicibacter sp. AOP3-A1-12 TaxID=3457701 RepID=UPI00403411FA